jgi:ABC-2 type transport system permease protein
MSDLAPPAPLPGMHPRPGAHPRPVMPLRDTWVMIGRNVRLTRRTLDALIMSLALPVMLLLMFVYLFGGAIAPDGTYVTYVVPGVILLCAGFASAQTAVSVAQDMRGGIIDRLSSLDVSPTAQIGGHVAASVLRNVVATVMVIGVAVAIGFRPHATVVDWLAAAGILLAFMLAISWLAAAFGLLAGEPEAAAGFSFFVSFLPYPSSAFVPVTTISPAWLRSFAEHQPITPINESVRGLLLDGPVGSNAWQALLWCAAILAISVAASAWLFRRRRS